MGTHSHRTDRTTRWARLNLVLVGALLTVCGIGLAAYSWTRPTTTAAPIRYRQTGALTYRAPASSSSVYGRAGVVTGEPVYRTIVTTLQVDYAYRFRTTAPAHLHGTEQLVAKVDNGQGIDRTVPLQPVTRFEGAAFSTTATLQLAALQGIVDSFAEAAGTTGSHGSYTVSIVPDVVVAGVIGSASLGTRFAKATAFTLSPAALTPGATSATSTGRVVAASHAAVGYPIVSTSWGSLSHPSGSPAALVAGLPIADARLLSLAIVAAGLVVGLFLGLPLLKEGASEHRRVGVASKFGLSLVDVEALPNPPTVIVVPLSSLGGLLRVGRQLECPILRHRAGSDEVYAVVDNGTIYRYEAVPSHGATARRLAPDPIPASTNGAGRH